jgi:hypothetical protein
MLDIVGHSYTVELRLYGKALDPERITRETGLQPCRTRLAGSQLGSRTFANAMWGYDGQGPANYDSLEAGLIHVLDCVAEVATLFQKYSKEYEAIWWCGHFQSAFDGGPTLSPRALERLAAFGVKLYIDNYFSQK